MRIWSGVLLIVLFTSICQADEASLQFEEANQLYRKGEFQKASAMYEQIVKNGYESPSLYYNLGNAYFKLRNLPSAILNYERARRLAPHDEDIQYNLRLCNLRVVDKIDALPTLFFVEWWRSFINLFSSDSWAMFGIGALWVTVVCGAIVIISQSNILRRMLLLSAVLGLLVSVCSFVGVVQRSHVEQSEQSAIVFSQTVSVKSAPDVQSTDLFVLHEGVKVELIDRVAEWDKIRLPDGKIGWLQAEVLQVI